MADQVGRGTSLAWSLGAIQIELCRREKGEAIIARLVRLEDRFGLRETPRPRIEIAYLKLLPRECRGPRHIVTVGEGADGREQCEKRPGEPPPHQAPPRHENVAYVECPARRSSAGSRLSPPRLAESLVQISAGARRSSKGWVWISLDGRFLDLPPRVRQMVKTHLTVR